MVFSIFIGIAVTQFIKSLILPIWFFQPNICSSNYSCARIALAGCFENVSMLINKPFLIPYAYSLSPVRYKVLVPFLVPHKTSNKKLVSKGTRLFNCVIFFNPLSKQLRQLANSRLNTEVIILSDQYLSAH